MLSCDNVDELTTPSYPLDFLNMLKVSSRNMETFEESVVNVLLCFDAAWIFSCCSYCNVPWLLLNIQPSSLRWTKNASFFCKQMMVIP